jgi:predicted O-methyltransferase YrrM
MSMLKTAAKRLMGKDVRQPPPPIEARDCYRSMIYTAHDLKPAPTKRLIDVTLAAVREIVEGRVDLSEVAKRPKVPDWYTAWPGEHYKLLAGLMRVLRPRNVIEIGTFSGLSALTMRNAMPEDGRLATFDVVPWKQIDGTHFQEQDFADGRLRQEIADLSNPAVLSQHRELLESADFMLIDAPKDGVFEYRLIEHFQTMKFRNCPIVLWDDTRLWSMLRFWRILPWPKMDVTSFGSWSGSGLCELS